MITSRDLAMMQAAAGTWRTTNCQVLRNTPTSDGMGGYADNWATIATTTCTLGPLLGQDKEVIEGLRLEQQNRYIIRLPAGQDIDIKDRILTSTPGLVPPSLLITLYEVQSVEAPRTIEISRVVQCIEVVT